MTFSTGIDIGGTKIAVGVFDKDGTSVAQKVMPTPSDYGELVRLCAALVDDLDRACGEKASVGIGAAGMIDRDRGSVFAPNIPCLRDHTFRSDCEKLMKRPVRLANDADCAALAEAFDGAGEGHKTVFGLIMGTGVGGGLIIDGRIHEGPHGLAGEIGHLPLPFRDALDGPIVECGCGQEGCLDKTISGPSLARLYHAMTGRPIEDPRHIVTSLQKGDADARRVLDQFYTTVAKAMVTVIHSYDPDIIVVSGGMNSLPGLYQEVPRRWERYALCKKLRTKFVPAKHGALSGLRGAARVGGIT